MVFGNGEPQVPGRPERCEGEALEQGSSEHAGCWRHDSSSAALFFAPCYLLLLDAGVSQLYL